MKPTNPTPVKVIAAVFFSDSTILPEVETALEKLFGAIDFRSQDFPFTVTDYYEQEMGSPLFRRIYSFTNLWNPGRLAEMKLKTNEIEEKFSRDYKRRVNIDVGYLDYNKLVLASAKYNWQKIYMGKGIYADLTLYYEKGKFLPFPWSFPDFKEATYYEVFMKIRNLYKSAMKTTRLAMTSPDEDKKT